ncbi:MAG TPA: DDE-type integrase/transposase/recombinase [Pseudonocardiaceae bacterium]
MPIVQACALTGRSRATHYRRADPLGVAALGPVHGALLPRRLPPSTITDDERAQVLALLNSEPYRDLAIGQVWARELDEGRYWCSESSMYRIARAAGQSRERRAQASHPPRVRPELVAHGPSEVWSWDITALKGPRKGEWYKLYVVLDIFSRYVPGWLVAHAEDAVVAKDFLADAVARNLVIPHTIHADRGGSMTSKPVSEMMIDLGISRSHSRPRTSNDNPFSEAQFKTLKYVPDFPERFGSLADARAFCDRFFPAYNHEHRHSGIGMHTPASVHFGTRDRHPRTTPGHPRPRPHTTPPAVQPPTPAPTPARAGVDQPTRPERANPVRSTVSFDLTATAAPRCRDRGVPRHGGQPAATARTAGGVASQAAAGGRHLNASRRGRD